MIEYKKKSFVKWEDEIIYETVMEKNLDPMKILAMENEDFLNIENYDYLRDVITMLSYFSYSDNYHSLSEEHKNIYHNSTILKNEVDEVIDFLLGDIKDAYNCFSQMFHAYYPCRKCNLLNRTVGKGQPEMTALKQTCWYMHFIDNTGIEYLKHDPSELKLIFTSSLSWEFGNYKLLKDRRVHFDESPEIFGQCNRERKKEIKDQDDFVKLMLFDNDFNKAYEMIKKEVYEKRKEEEED